MEKIILDTNFLLIPARFNVDIFSEIDRICGKYKLYIIDKTVDELKKIIDTGKGKDKDAAKLALGLVENRKVEKIKTKEGTVDDLIISLDGYIVATQDKELKRRLKEKDVKVISLRQKNYLIFG